MNAKCPRRQLGGGGRRRRGGGEDWRWRGGDNKASFAWKLCEADVGWAARLVQTPTFFFLAREPPLGEREEEKRERFLRTVEFEPNFHEIEN